MQYTCIYTIKHPIYIYRERENDLYLYLDDVINFSTISVRTDPNIIMAAHCMF